MEQPALEPKRKIVSYTICPYFSDLILNIHFL